MCHSWFKWYACKKLQIYFRYSVYFCTCDWFIKLQHVQNYKTFFSNISKLLYLMLWPCDIFSTVCLDSFQCFQMHASHIDLQIIQRFILIQVQILSYLVYPRFMPLSFAIMIIIETRFINWIVLVYKTFILHNNIFGNITVVQLCEYKY